MNTPVGNVMPKLDVAPKRRTIEIEFPAESHPADEQPGEAISSHTPSPTTHPVVVSAPDSVPNQPDTLAGPVEDVPEPETRTAPTSSAAPEPTAAPAPTDELPAGGTTSGSHIFSQDETIKLLMDLAGLQEDLERAREQTNSARRHVEIVQEQLSKTLVEKSAVQEQLQRLMAEFDNYRRRAEREKAEALERGKQTVLLATLEVLDNIERALATGRAEGGTLADFLAGVELIQRQVMDSLASFGVKPIPAVGEVFDPLVHEAIATDETDEYKPNTVLAELKRGYKLGDRLLRPAMVRVAVRPGAS